MFFNLVNCFSGNSTVQRNEINAVFCMKTNHIDKILCGQLGKISLIVDDTVINRNSTDHGRTFAGQFLTEWLCISMAGKIHDCFCAHVDGTHNLFHLNVIILAVS